MKVYPTTRALCDHCKVIRRHGRVVVVHPGTAPCARRSS